MREVHRWTIRNCTDGLPAFGTIPWIHPCSRTWVVSIALESHSTDGSPLKERHSPATIFMRLAYEWKPSRLNQTFVSPQPRWIHPRMRSSIFIRLFLNF